MDWFSFEPMLLQWIQRNELFNNCSRFFVEKASSIICKVLIGNPGRTQYSKKNEDEDEDDEDDEDELQDHGNVKGF